MAVASGHLNSTGVLLEVGGVLPMIHGGEMQQTPSTVAASLLPQVSHYFSVIYFVSRNVEYGIDCPGF